jgi:hypothetical protein
MFSFQELFQTIANTMINPIPINTRMFSLITTPYDNKILETEQDEWNRFTTRKGNKPKEGNQIFAKETFPSNNEGK